MQHLRPSSVGTSLSYYSPSLVLCSWDHLENKRIAGKTLSCHMATWGIALVSFTILQWLLSLRWLTEPQASTGQKSAFFCYLCFLTSLGVITAAKNLISYSILFLALLLKEKDLDYVSIQDPKVAVLLLPGSTFNLVAHQNVPCTVWVGGGGSGADVVWVQVPRSRPSQIWYQLDKHSSHRHTHSHRSSFRWN